MARLRAAIIIAVLTVLIVGVGGEKDHHIHARQARGGEKPVPKPCKDKHGPGPFDPLCDPSESGNPDDGGVIVDSSTTEATSTTPDGTALEHAHWCRFGNGTYLPLGHTFMHTVCSMCQCTTSRAIRCQMLQCLPTYCFDNTMPVRKEGYCCAQCAYEVAKDSCEYNGMTYQHGVVIKSVENKMQCWCQLGNIECRNYIGSLLDNLNLLSDERVIYIIVIVLAVVLIFGFMVCASCTLAFYYYYQRHQHTFQNAYDEYVNSAGWQPMSEEEQAEADSAAAAANKQAEAELYQPPSYAPELVPPPYTVHSDGYSAKEKAAQM